MEWVHFVGMGGDRCSARSSHQRVVNTWNWTWWMLGQPARKGYALGRWETTAQRSVWKWSLQHGRRTLWKVPPLWVQFSLSSLLSLPAATHKTPHSDPPPVARVLSDPLSLVSLLHSPPLVAQAPLGSLRTRGPTRRTRMTTTVNFRCQLDWVKENTDNWYSSISGCVCQGMSRGD